MPDFTALPEPPAGFIESNAVLRNDSPGNPSPPTVPAVEDDSDVLAAQKALDDARRRAEERKAAAPKPEPDLADLTRRVERLELLYDNLPNKGALR